MIGVSYAHSFYLFFKFGIKVPDVYFEIDKDIASIIEKYSINPLLELKNLNLYTLANMAIEEIENVASVNCSRMELKGMVYKSSPQDKAFYGELQEDIKNAFGVKTEEIHAPLANFEFIMSKPYGKEWGRNIVSTIPLDDILQAIKSSLNKDNGRFLRDTIKKGLNREVALEDIDSRITVEYRNEAERQGIFRVVVMVKENETDLFKPYVLGYQCANAIFL
ncbi:unnamed protein product, partial [marine sediment metagenome]